LSANCGAIYVAATKTVTRTEVAEQVKQYWLRVGATLDDQVPFDIEPLTLDSSEEPARLGYAVSEACDGWIGVLDSEVYSADAKLAAYLARKLKTRVCWYVCSGASDGARIKLLGTWRCKPPKRQTYPEVVAFLNHQRFPELFVDFSNLASDAKQRKKYTCFGLRGVSPDAYDGGPAVRTEEVIPKKALELWRVSEFFRERAFGRLREAVEHLSGPQDVWRVLNDACTTVRCNRTAYPLAKDESLRQALLSLAQDTVASPAPVEQHVKEQGEAGAKLSANGVAACYIVVTEVAALHGDRELFERLLGKIRSGLYKRLSDEIPFAVAHLKEAGRIREAEALSALRQS
jgi:hypothetical protein